MANLMILDKVSANAHYVDVVAPASTLNGHVNVLGVKNSDGTYACAAPTAVTAEGMVIIADIAMSYEVEKLMNDKVFATGEIVRALVPSLGDVISIPVSSITATVAVAKDKIVVPKANTSKVECLDALAGTEVLAFTIQKLFTKAGVAMAQLRCIRTQK